ncbi:DUF429 domain-containing protein [Rhizobium sp. TH2]|nr:DUF429 domain-containing protein [Rhizobium sp. TH2]
MNVFGIDFTSSPSKRKPITCVECEFDDHTLDFVGIREWQNFGQLEQFLREPGPWIAGIDFPFGQSRKFVETIYWPPDWEEYVLHASSLGRQGFRDALTAYRLSRPMGDREHRRAVDVAASSISPQKLYGVPVGLMFFEGAARLLSSGITIPHMLAGDPNRIAVEAYPGVLARRLIGRRSYKNDAKKKQTSDQLAARYEMLRLLQGGSALHIYGFAVKAPELIAYDPGADHLDALFCAIQAAWAWKQRTDRFGAPSNVDTLEGWIADPTFRNPQN